MSHIKHARSCCRSDPDRHTSRQLICRAFDGCTHYWQQTSLPVILEVAALIGVNVFIGVRLAPDHTERTVELIFTLIIMGIVLFVLFAIVGLPLWLFLVWWNDWSFPGWALWPCGADSD